MSSILQHKPADESPLDRLEREANDDFQMLEELGPTHFGTEHLLEMREHLRQQLSVFDRRQHFALSLGGTAAGWVVLGILTARMGWFWMALAAHSLAAASLVGFFVILFFLKKRFESRGELEHTAREIETELRRRAPAKQKLF